MCSIGVNNGIHDCSHYQLWIVSTHFIHLFNAFNVNICEYGWCISRENLYYIWQMNFTISSSWLLQKTYFPLLLYNTVYRALVNTRLLCQHTMTSSTIVILFFYYENQRWNEKYFEKNCLGQITRIFAAAIVVINVGELTTNS